VSWRDCVPDLSQILFVRTANSLETISASLLDRREIIQLIISDAPLFPESKYRYLNYFYIGYTVSLRGGGRKSLTSCHTREQDRALSSEDERVRSTRG